MNHRAALLSLCLLVPACADDSGDVGDILAYDCEGEHLALRGLKDLDADSVATVELDSAVIGVGGFLPGATASYALTVRNVLADQLATVGDHDVGAINIKYVEAPANANCQTPGECWGFVATAGTFTVLSTSPYRAEFTLADLHDHDGSSDTLGPAISGKVYGCLTAAP
ncbi:MAG TPA: hypothetical protein VM513_13770 [Kofleriaceae bacterium]|jgi:hypothetical protein|nr:hypothetical protein [Kofleriaceae bacterium]